MSPLTPKLFAISLAAGAALASAATWFGSSVWYGREIAEIQLKHTTQERDDFSQAIKDRDAANQKAKDAEGVIAELRTRVGKKVIVYRDAVKSDPDCQSQAQEALRCPRPW